MLKARAVHPNDKDHKERTLVFIKNEARDGLFPRPANLLDDSIRGGQAITIEDNNEIVAVALMFDYSGNRYHYLELGTHLVARTHEGRGFQVALTRLQLMQSTLDLEDAEIFAIMENNSPSQHNAEKHLTFKLGELNEEALALRECRGVRSSLDNLVYTADDNTIANALTALKSNIKDGVLKTHKLNTEIHLDFPWLNALLQAGPH